MRIGEFDAFMSGMGLAVHRTRGAWLVMGHLAGEYVQFEASDREVELNDPEQIVDLARDRIRARADALRGRKGAAPAANDQ